MNQSLSITTSRLCIRVSEWAKSAEKVSEILKEASFISYAKRSRLVMVLSVLFSICVNATQYTPSLNQEGNLQYNGVTGYRFSDTIVGSDGSLFGFRDKAPIYGGNVWARAFRWYDMPTISPGQAVAANLTIGYYVNENPQTYTLTYNIRGHSSYQTLTADQVTFDWLAEDGYSLLSGVMPVSVSGSGYTKSFSSDATLNLKVRSACYGTNKKYGFSWLLTMDPAGSPENDSVILSTAFENFKINTYSSPSLLSPASSSTGVPGTITFSWSDLSLTGGLQYHLQISTSSSFSSIAYENLYSGTAADVVLTSGTYYWRVRIAQSRTSDNASTWGSARILTIQEQKPEISVVGSDSLGNPNVVDISDGDNSPTTGDGTDFGSTPQFTVSTRDFYIWNTGNAALSIGTVSYPNGFTVLVNPASSVAAGEQTYFRVRLNANEVGTYAGDISFNNNDSNESPFNFRITGTVASIYYTITTIPTTGGSTSGGGPKASGSSCTVTANPYSGYSFSNWTEGGTVVSTSANYTFSVTGARTLTANFSPVTFAVTYIANGATSGSVPSLQNKTYGVGLTLQTNSGGLAKTGYTFAGWNTQADGRGIDYAPGGMYTANAAVNLYAKWTSLAQPILSVTPTSFPVTKETGTTTFSVANTGSGTMAWTAAVTSGGAWARITSGASGSNAGTVTVGYDANPSGGIQRSATVRVTASGATGSPVDVTITQAANPAGGGGGTAVRTIDGATVSITVTPAAGTSAWGFEETIPAGLTPADLTGPNANWNATSRKITWYSTGTAAATLGYTVSGTAGTYTLAGAVNFDGVNGAVSGDSQIVKENTSRRVALVNPDYFRILKMGALSDNMFYSIASGTVPDGVALTDRANWTGVGGHADFVETVLTNAGFVVDVFEADELPPFVAGVYQAVIVQDPLKTFGQVFPRSAETQLPDVLQYSTNSTFLTRLAQYHENGSPLILMGDAVRLLENGTGRLGFGKTIEAHSVANEVSANDSSLPAQWMFIRGNPFCGVDRNGSGVYHALEGGLMQADAVIGELSLFDGNDIPRMLIWSDTVYCPADAVSLLDAQVSGQGGYVLRGDICSPPVYQVTVNDLVSPLAGYTYARGRKVYFWGSDSFFDFQYRNYEGTWHAGQYQEIRFTVSDAAKQALIDLIQTAIEEPQESVVNGWQYPRADRAGLACASENTRHPVNANSLVSKFEIQGISAGETLIGDVDGDGQRELVVVPGTELRLYSGNGTLKRTVALPRTCSLAVLEDVDNDGVLDIGLGSNGAGFSAYFYRGDGTPLKTFVGQHGGGSDNWIAPIALSGSKILMGYNAGYARTPRGVAAFDYATAAENWYYQIGPACGLYSVADMDGDGKLDVTMNSATVHNGASGNGTTDGDLYLVVVDETGTKKVSQKYPSPSDGGAVHFFADLDGDGICEILGFEDHDPVYYGGISQIHVYGTNGAIRCSFDGPSNTYWTYAIGDLTPDSGLEIVASATRTDTTYLLDKSLGVIRQAAGVGRVKALADLTGDGVLEIVTLSSTGILRVLDTRLNIIASIQAGNGDGTVALSDLDGDGIVDIVCRTDKVNVFSFASSSAVSIFDNFETYTCDTWPNPWVEDGNAGSSPANNKVVDDPTGQANKALKLQGVVGGYWEAIGYLPCVIPDNFMLEMRVFNGSEPLPDYGHQTRCSIGLMQGTSWVNYCRGLLTFDKDGNALRFDNTVIGQYALDTWHHVKLQYQRTSTAIIVSYWIDGEAVGSASEMLTNIAGEHSLDHIRLGVGAGTGYFDNVTLTLLEAADYIDNPDSTAALSSLGSYDGFFYNEGAFGDYAATAVRGTLNVKITGLGGKLTAKAVLQRGSLNFSAAAWTGTEADGTFRAALTARGGERLDLRVRQNRIWGTLSGGAVDGTLELDGARNRFVEKGDLAAQALLNRYLGYYTVALPAYDEGSLGSAEGAPQGVGYLAVTVGAKGSAKVAGILADGTKVTQSSRLVLFGGEDGACVPFFVPLYSKQGWAGGLLWVAPDRGAVVTDRELGWFVRWENPGKGPEGFRELLDACGGYYSGTPSLAAHYLFSAGVGDSQYVHAGGAESPVAAPDGVAVTAAGLRMTMVKGVKPKKISEGGGVWYEYDEANPANATLTFTARTGLLKGKFSLYYDYWDVSDRLVHKAVNVPYAGVLTPVRDGAFAELPIGLGHCLVPESDPALKAYKIKRSCPVWLEAE